VNAGGDKVRTSSARFSDTAILQDVEGFSELEEEWEELYEACPSATPFQSWAWLYTWWEHYGEDYELCLITVREDDVETLVGIVPLMLERCGPLGRLGRLLFIGSGISDRLDVLVRQGWEERVAEVVASTLMGMGCWRVLDLQEVGPEAAAWELFGRWPGPRLSVWQSRRPVIDAMPWEEVLASLSRNLRSTLRRALRRAEEDGLRSELADVEDAERAGRTLVSLHREAWQGRDIGPEHLTERFGAHLGTAARRMTARGLGAISEFRRDGEVLVSHFLLFGKDSVGAYLQGASQEALQRYQFSSLYIWDAMNVTLSEGDAYLDLLRGEEPYKLRWATRVEPNRRLILGKDPLSWAPYAAYHALRSAAKAYVASQDAPRWAKDAKDRYRALRNSVARYKSRGKRS
jgi:CelD/BcsL family acetyltransferase involved in cellulose biosynthesis